MKCRFSIFSPYLLIVGLSFLASSPAHAFQFGLMEVPDDLLDVRDLVVTDPGRCISKLKKRYSAFQVLLDRKSSRPGENLTSNSGLVRQVMAVCLLKKKRFEHALLILDSIQYAAGSGFEASIRTKLIRALIFSRIGSTEKLKAARALLREGLTQIGDMRGAVAMRLKYQYLRELGRIASLSGNDPEAKKLLDKALKLGLMLHDDNLIGWAHYFLADYYYRTKQLGMAMSQFMDAQKNGGGRQVQAKYLAALASKRIALIYQEQNDFEKAIPYAQQSMQLFQALSNKVKQIGAFMLLAELYKSQEHYNQALVQYFNALELAKEQHRVFDIAQARVEIGDIYIKLNHYLKAKEQLSLAHRSFVRQRENEGIRFSLTRLGELHIATGEVNAAIGYLQLAEKLIERQNLETGKHEVYSLLATSFERKGLYHQALGYYKKHYGVSQQLVMEFNQLKRDSFALQYQSAEQQQYIMKLESLLKVEEQREKQLQLTLLILMCIAFVFAVLFFIFKGRSRRFATKNEQLAKLLALHSSTGLPYAKNACHSVSALIREFAGQQVEQAELPSLCLAVIKLDCFAELYESEGGERARKIQDLLGRFLKNNFSELNLYHLRDNLLLGLAPSSSLSCPNHFGNNLAAAFTRFTQQVSLPDNVSIGICGYPFLPHAPSTLSESQTLDVAYIALEGAKQLQQASGHTQWLALNAISGMHPAFLGGEVRSQSKMAIEKGLIKVSHAGKKIPINW